MRGSLVILFTLVAWAAQEVKSCSQAQALFDPPDVYSPEPLHLDEPDPEIPVVEPHPEELHRGPMWSQRGEREKIPHPDERPQPQHLVAATSKTTVRSQTFEVNNLEDIQTETGEPAPVVPDSNSPIQFFQPSTSPEAVQPDILAVGEIQPQTSEVDGIENIQTEVDEPIPNGIENIQTEADEPIPNGIEDIQTEADELAPAMPDSKVFRPSTAPDEPESLAIEEMQPQETADLVALDCPTENQEQPDIGQSNACAEADEGPADAATLSEDELGGEILISDANAVPLAADVAHLNGESVDDELEDELPRSPLELPQPRLFNLETANHLGAGAVQLSVGSHQTLPGDVTGTGHQVYYGGIEWGVTDSLQIGLSAQIYDDPPHHAFDRISSDLVRSVIPSLESLPSLPSLPADIPLESLENLANGLSAPADALEALAGGSLDDLSLSALPAGTSLAELGALVSGENSVAASSPEASGDVAAASTGSASAVLGHYEFAPNITLASVAASAKLRLLETERFSAALQGSLELLPLASELFEVNNALSGEWMGSVHLPLSYTVSPELQVHVTPGVSFLPDKIHNFDFYDTVFSVGAGVNWQPSNRWSAYGTVNVPIGPGGNTINRDLSIDRQVVWAAGSRYNVTPQVGVELYATNGMGVTPTTGILTSIPEGNELLLGARLNYVPNTGQGYRSNFRNSPDVPRAARDYQLLVDGITLTTANTIEPGNISISGGMGTQGSYDVGLAYSPSESLQLEAILEQFSGNADPAATAGDDSRYMLGAKLQLLNQQQGAPFSLAARVLGGRDADMEHTVGVLFAELPVTYQLGASTALFVTPKMAAFGDGATFGVGVGVNQRIAGGLQLLGEVTPVFNQQGATVWAAGLRYSLPKAAANLDLYATNAVGRNGLGSLIHQAETRFGVGLNWVLGR